MKKFIFAFAILSTVLVVSSQIFAQTQSYTLKSSTELMTYLGVKGDTDVVKYNVLINALNAQIDKARSDLTVVAQTAGGASVFPKITASTQGTLKLEGTNILVSVPLTFKAPTNREGIFYMANLTLTNVATNQVYPVGSFNVVGSRSAQGTNLYHQSYGNMSVLSVIGGGSTNVTVTGSRAVAGLPSGTYTASVATVTYLTTKTGILQTYTLPTNQTSQLILNVNGETVSTPVTPVTALEISGVSTQGGLTATTRQVVWQTNRNSDSKVFYGQAPGVYNSTISALTKVTSHNLTLSNLYPGVKYYYSIESVDAQGIVKRTPEYSFTMPGSMVSSGDTGGTGLNSSPEAVISNISVADSPTTRGTKIISWTTNVNTDSKVWYGLTSGQYPLSVVKADRSTDHQVPLENLTAGAKYYFIIQSVTPLGNIKKSSESFFTVPVIPASGDTGLNVNPNTAAAAPEIAKSASPASRGLLQTLVPFPALGIDVRTKTRAITVDTIDVAVAVTGLSGDENPAGFINSISVDGGNSTKYFQTSAGLFVKDPTSPTGYYYRLSGLNIQIPPNTTRQLTVNLYTNALTDKVIKIGVYNNGSMGGVKITDSTTGITSYPIVSGSNQFSFVQPATESQPRRRVILDSLQQYMKSAAAQVIGIFGK
ncbi:MAG: fibronectin type III domain-containing protein [Patescibacteria group bacterium]